MFAFNNYVKVIQFKQAEDVIVQAEEKYGLQSPFNTINKLCLIASKVRQFLKDFEALSSNYASALTWALTYIVDAIEAKYLDWPELGAGLIKGSSAIGNRGIIDGAVQTPVARLLCQSLAAEPEPPA